MKIDKRTHPFAQIDTRALNDGSISWKAKGLHAYLLSKPRIWQVRFSDLVNHATDRAYSVRSALDELRTAGYAVLRPLKDEQGLFCGSCWTIYELPRRSLNANGDDGFRNLRNTQSPKNGVSGHAHLAAVVSTVVVFTRGIQKMSSHKNLDVEPFSPARWIFAARKCNCR